jgi:hypothetical protein
MSTLLDLLKLLFSQTTSGGATAFRDLNDKRSFCADLRTEVTFGSTNDETRQTEPDRPGRDIKGAADCPHSTIASARYFAF